MTFRAVTPLFPDVAPDQPPDIESALANLGSVFRNVRPTMQEIKCVVIEHYGLKLGDFDSHSRVTDLVKARQVFYFLCHKLTGSTLPAIGRRSGGHDHTTVLWGVKKIADLSRKSKLFAEELEVLRFRIAERVLLRNGRNGNGGDQKSN